MKQTKTGSFIESLLNVAIGYGIAVASQVFLFPFFDIHVPVKTNMLIALFFTVISIVRSYVLRRWFNARLYKLSLLLQEKSNE